MDIADLVRAGVVSAGLLLSGCSALPSRTPQPPAHGDRYSVEEVLLAYDSEILPLYASSDYFDAIQRLVDQKAVVSPLFSQYLSNVDEESVQSASRQERRRLAIAYHDWGYVLVLTDDPARACSAFEKSLALDPESAATLFAYAQVLYRSARQEDALSALERCIELPRNEENARILESARMACQNLRAALGR